jgi:cytochrome c biogenesis protein CcdA/thiol-disulfide isomerase/thioredoxin
MLVLSLIGLIGGLITGISPCILPALPVVFLAGGAAKRTGESPATDPAAANAGRPRRSRRPYAVIAGLVLSFSAFTLLGSALISLLNLPTDILHYAGLVLLVAIGLGMILNVVVLTLSFAVGATLPLLGFALAGRQVADRVKAFRTRAPLVRRVRGVVMIVLAVALAFNLADALQRALPGYTDSLQQGVENNSAFRPQLSGLTDGTNTQLSHCTDNSGVLQECGKAPAIADITEWLNTPDGKPVSLPGLRGKVVLVDFWTYSCINCQRSIPHVEALSKAYQAAGLQVIGVHTPEFVFERDPGNVASATKTMGITYPVALDNGYATFDNYRNQYWPAEYLIDAQGNVRHISFGEGDYTQTEKLIRQLLTQADPAARLPAATDVPNTTPDSASITPETYLNYNQIQRYAGTPLAHDAPASYQPAAALPVNNVTLGGTWTAGDNYLTAGGGAKLVLHYDARDVYLVLAGHGTVTVTVTAGSSPATVIRRRWTAARPRVRGQARD